MKKVLIIEDSRLVRCQVSTMLESAGIEAVALESVEDYIASRWKYRDVDLMLLDLNLPGRDGFSLLKELSPISSVLVPPIMIISSQSDANTIRMALAAGAKDYIIKPFNMEVFEKKVQQLFYNRGERMMFPEKYFELVYEAKRLYRIFVSERDAVLPKQGIEVLAKNCLDFLNENEKIVLFSNNSYATFGYTFRHVVNVAILSGMIGKWLGLSSTQLPQLVRAGLLHDVGKTKVPLEILLKPGELEPVEYNLIQKHSSYGAELLQRAGYQQDVVEAALQHHERLDGSGYPAGLEGRQIGLFAKIIAVADVYDAMTSNRVYTGGDSLFAVIEELLKSMFGKLDPYICSVFLQHVKASMVGQTVVMADGSKSVVAAFEESGFSAPLLQMSDGKIRKNTGTIVKVDLGAEGEDV